MGIFGYLALGSVMYIAGFMIHLKLLRAKRQSGEITSVKHPLILGFLAGCFVLMLVVSALLGRFVLGHTSMDWAFIFVNSAVATGVFYFGLNPDTSTMNLPD